MNKQQGGAIIEFIIVLPLLLLLMIAAAEVGAVFYGLNTITKSVQDATRYLSNETVGMNPSSDQIANVVKLVKYGSLTNTSTLVKGTVTVPDPTVNGEHITVTATYTHPLILGGTLNNLMQIGGGSFPTELQLPVASVMRFAQL